MSTFGINGNCFHHSSEYVSQKLRASEFVLNDGIMLEVIICSYGELVLYNMGSNRVGISYNGKIDDLFFTALHNKS